MSQVRQAAPLGIRLTTYLELEQMVQAFARGHLNLLILIGGHGLGKSRIVRQALAGQACWLEGNLSVFGLYCHVASSFGDAVWAGYAFKSARRSAGAVARRADVRLRLLGH